MMDCYWWWIVQTACYVTVQLLLAGLQDIDVNDWKRHTKYRGEYNLNHPVIVNFWKVHVCLTSIVSVVA